MWLILSCISCLLANFAIFRTFYNIENILLVTVSIYLFIHLFIYLFIFLFTYLFIYLFIHSFIYFVSSLILILRKS